MRPVAARAAVRQSHRGTSSSTIPAGLLSELTFTGYYPAVPWLAYVLVGMAVGRLDLTSRRTATALAAGGAAAAVLATVVSRALTGPARRSRQALLTDPPAPDVDAAALLDRISAGLPGTTPTDGAWQWLLVVAPHTATPFDLAADDRLGARSSSGCRAAGPSACSGVSVRRDRGDLLRCRHDDADALLPARGAPARRTCCPTSLRDSYRFHVLLLLGIGLVFVAAARRGPLERIVGAASRARALAP